MTWHAHRQGCSIVLSSFDVFAIRLIGLKETGVC